MCTQFWYLGKNEKTPARGSKKALLKIKTIKLILKLRSAIKNVSYQKQILDDQKRACPSKGVTKKVVRSCSSQRVYI